jgi:hypothetical protein
LDYQGVHVTCDRSKQIAYRGVEGLGHTVTKKCAKTSQARRWQWLLVEKMGDYKGYPRLSNNVQSLLRRM